MSMISTPLMATTKVILFYLTLIYQTLMNQITMLQFALLKRAPSPGQLKRTLSRKVPAHLINKQTQAQERKNIQKQEHPLHTNLQHHSVINIL